MPAKIASAKSAIESVVKRATPHSEDARANKFKYMVFIQLSLSYFSEVKID